MPSPPAAGSPIGRREFLLGLGAVAWSLSGCSGRPEPVAPPPVCHPGERPRWPGHRPCRVYLGMSYPDDVREAVAVTGAIGVQRSYFDWDHLHREDEVIRDDHSNRRLPWVSFKPPRVDPGGWAEVASGDRDEDLRERARHYAGLEQPIIVTFHHEPSNDSTGAPAEYAAAFSRVHDVMHAETGLSNVAFVPIIGEWEYNPRNDEGDPDRWLSDGVLDRAAFLGVDVYQNEGGEAYPERLGRVLEWLDDRGYPDLMVGVGETGCTDTFGSPSAVEWWSESWRWVEDYVARIGVVAYFNSTRNSKQHVFWPLEESPQKLAAYQRSLESPVSCRLA